MHRCSYCSRFVYIPQGVDVVMMNIDEPTPIPLQDDATQEEIITKVFEKRAGRLAVFAGNDLALCLRYQAARWGGLRNEIKHRNKVAYSLLGKTTVDFIATVVTGLEENQERRALLKEISSFLEQGSQDKDSLNSAAAILLQLCVRVWLMCEIPVIPPRFPTTWQTYSNSRRWLNDTQTLRQHLLSCFPKTSTASENAILERSFQLYNIQKVANIAIIWTDDILEHLRVRDPTHDSEPYTVSVFHHRRFLEYHAARSSTLFPDGLIVETIKTLDLLLPFEHKDTREWYIKLAAVKRLDETACKNQRPMEAEDRVMESFKFWRERLAILKATFDGMEPATAFHFWLDKRRPMQWATFWVAVLVFCLTVFFGIVQSIEGALQAYKAYHPTD